MPLSVGKPDINRYLTRIPLETATETAWTMSFSRAIAKARLVERLLFKMLGRRGLFVSTNALRARLEKTLGAGSHEPGRRKAMKEGKS